jgi:hypothetical protein
MSHSLKVGDRVRVSGRYQGEDYQPGDKDTVSWVPPTTAGVAPTHYHVMMDMAGPAATTVMFAPDEIESDV